MSRYQNSNKNLLRSQNSYFPPKNDNNKWCWSSQLCLKCNEKCGECETFPDTCTQCSDTTFELVKQSVTVFTQKDCLYDCNARKHYKNETMRQCVECHDTCDGCYGPTDMECKQCIGFRLDLVSWLSFTGFFKILI